MSPLSRAVGRTARPRQSKWQSAASVAALFLLIASLFALSGCGPTPAARQFAEAESLLVAGDYTAAVEKYSYVVAHFQSSEFAPMGQSRIAVIYDRHLSDTRRALDAYSTLLFLFPESAEAERAREEVARLYSAMGAHGRAAEEYDRLAAERPGEGARLSYRAALEYIEAGELSLAGDRLAVLLKRHPGSPEAPEARYRIAYIHYLQGDTEGAVEEYDRLIASVPGGPLAAEAVMGKARALGDAGKIAESIELLEGLRGRYPNEEALDVMLGWLRKRLAEGPRKEKR